MDHGCIYFGLTLVSIACAFSFRWGSSKAMTSSKGDTAEANATRLVTSSVETLHKTALTRIITGLNQRPNVISTTERHLTTLGAIKIHDHLLALEIGGVSDAGHGTDAAASSPHAGRTPAATSLLKQLEGGGKNATAPKVDAKPRSKKKKKMDADWT